MSAQRQRYVICHCPICDGALVPPRTKRTHANTQARTQTTQLGGASRISKDGQVSAIVPMSMLPVPPPSAAHYTVPLREPEALIDQFPTLTVFPRTSSSAVEQEMIDHGSLTWEDIDLQTFGSALPNLGPNFHDPESLLQYVEHHEGLNAATAAASRPLTAREAHLQPPEVTGTADEPSVAEMIESAYRQELTRTDGGQDDGEGAWSDPDRDDMDNDDDDEDDDQTGGGDSADPTPGELSHPSVTLIDEDSPDPFLSESSHSSQTSSIALLPPHIMCIYSLVTWLHLFFHLPRAACNALLSGLALLVFFLNPNVATPFVTLSAANRALGLEFPIHILPVCPGCKEVFPMSDKTHEACTACGADLFIAELTARGKRRKGRVPIIAYPLLTISEQLPSILSTPGVEGILDQWRKLKRAPGFYQDIFDGAIPRGLRGVDGKAFFSNEGDEVTAGPDGELRLGLTLGVDWFSYIRSNIAPSHSSCPTSFSICNLPPEYRYRTSNLMCTSILPGPKEQTADEIQRFLRPIITDLLRLYKDGIRVPTASCPNGRLVRVILVAVICDKPAAHKISGFGGHSHTCLCTECWIKRQQAATAAAFERGAFEPRTDAEQRRLGEQYRVLTTDALRKKFVKDHATRYTQLSRLPYFDLVKQTVIDPMHNLFLGVVKTHFYNIWVQGGILREKHELRVLHDMLENFTLPGTCGKLPKDIGMPAGGSLTADQWLLLASVQGPIIIPQLWSDCLPEDHEQMITNRVEKIARIEAEKKAKAEKVAAERKARKDKTEAEKQVKRDQVAEERRVKKALAEAEKEAKRVAREEMKRIREAEKQRLAAEKQRLAEAAGTSKGGRRGRGSKRNQEAAGLDTDLSVNTNKRTRTEESSASAPTIAAVATEASTDEAGLSPPSPRLSTILTTLDKQGPSSMPTAPPASSVVPEDDKQQDGDPSKPDQPFSLHPDDPKNFLKLSTAITLLSKHTLLEHQIVEAELLIREYCTELITLYGPSVIKPNHHYATHVPDCARNFGPLHGFWTFLFERLNKVLKSFNTNNHSNGELETTFFQEFQRTCLSSRVTYMLSGYPPDSLQSRLAELMLKASNEDRGTVAALTTLSQELDDENQDAGKRFVLSPRYERKAMGSETYRLLASWINSRFPHLPVHCISERPQHLRSLPLNTVADYFDYVVLNATRYYSSAATGSNRSAMVEVDIKGDSSYSDLECGELLDILQFDRGDGSPCLQLGRMRWFKAWSGERPPVWDTFRPLNVRLWVLEEFHLRDNRFPQLIELDKIKGHLGRTVVSLGTSREKVWATIALKKTGDTTPLTS